MVNHCSKKISKREKGNTKQTKSLISAHARAKLSQKHGARESRLQSPRYLTVTCGTGKQTKIVKSRQRYSPVIVHFYKNCPLSRALIGSFLSSIRGQTDKILKRCFMQMSYLYASDLPFKNFIYSRYLTRFGSCCCLVIIVFVKKKQSLLRNYSPVVKEASKTSKAELTDYLNTKEMQMTNQDVFRFSLSKDGRKMENGGSLEAIAISVILICNLQPWKKVLGTRMLCNELSVCLGPQVNKRARCYPLKKRCCPIWGGVGEFVR